MSDHPIPPLDLREQIDRIMLWAAGAAILSGLMTQLPAILRGLKLID